MSAEEQKVKYEEKFSKIRKQEELLRYTETKAGQMVVSYIFLVSFIFSSITTTSSSSSSLALRRVRWVFFSQILMISAIFWLAIATVIQRILRVKYHYEQSLIEQEMLSKEMYLVQSGQKMGRGQQQERVGRLVKPDPRTQRLWYTYVFAIISPLIAFTVLTLSACLEILRDDKASQEIGTPG